MDLNQLQKETTAVADSLHGIRRSPSDRPQYTDEVKTLRAAVKALAQLQKVAEKTRNLMKKMLHDQEVDTLEVNALWNLTNKVLPAKPKT